MELKSEQIESLKSFCTLILCEYNEAVFTRCKECLENAEGGIPDVLYVLSGSDIDPDDPFGNIADEDKQLVKPQYYLVSSDAGAPDLDDFFWFIDNIKMARGLDFNIDEEKFSDDDCIIEWLAELSSQLDDLYIVNFDGGSEDYHFTIFNKEDSEKAMELFKKMTEHIKNYSFTSCVITSDFEG